MPWWLSHPSAGLDIGSHSVKWSAVEPSKLRSYLLSAPLLENRSSLEEGLADPLRQRRLAQLLAEWRNTAPVWPKKIAASVQGTGVICGYVEFPALTATELNVALPAAVAGNVPFPPGEQMLGHQVVPPLADPAGTGVFYTVSLRREVLALNNWLRECSLEPLRIEATPMALTREFARNHTPDAEQFSALVHCGFRWTQVVVQRGGFPYYARDFALAGGDFTRAYQRAGRLEWAAAEEQKLAQDLSHPGPGPVESILLKWSERIRLHLDHFTRQNSVHIEQVYLSGGSAAWQGLTARLQDFLKLPVIRDDWERMRAPRDCEDQAVFYKAAMGLALGGG